MPSVIDIVYLREKYVKIYTHCCTPDEPKRYKNINRKRIISPDRAKPLRSMLICVLEIFNSAPTASSMNLRKSSIDFLNEEKNSRKTLNRLWNKT